MEFIISFLGSLPTVLWLPLVTVGAVLLALGAYKLVKEFFPW